MSVSSRSPTISGRLPPTRRIVSSSSGRSGLPATVGSHPGELPQQADQDAVPRRRAVGRRDRQVGVAGHPGQPVAHQHRRPHHVAPQHVGAVAGHQRHRVVADRTGTSVSAAKRGVEPAATQQRHGGPLAEPVAQHPRRRLGRGDHVVGAGVDAELAQVGGHVSGWPGGVVGDERDADARSCGRRPGARRRPELPPRRCRRPRRDRASRGRRRWPTAPRRPPDAARRPPVPSPYDAPMDSSLVVGPPSVGRPLRLLPFRGWRLTPGRIGDPATARLFARPYRDVAERLDRWREAGQLLRDPEPAIYVHEYTAAGLTVRGLVGALDIAHRAATVADRAVIPHEGIHPEQVGELADRMSTWELNPAPILLVHRGPAPVRELVDRTLARPPLHEYVDRADQRHRVWAIHDPADIDGLNAALLGLARADRRRTPSVRRLPADAAAGARRRQRPRPRDAGRPGRHPALPRRHPPDPDGHRRSRSWAERARRPPRSLPSPPPTLTARCRRTRSSPPTASAGPPSRSRCRPTERPSRCCTTTCCRRSASATGPSATTTPSTRR